MQRLVDLLEQKLAHMAQCAEGLFINQVVLTHSYRPDHCSSFDDKCVR